MKKVTLFTYVLLLSNFAFSQGMEGSKNISAYFGYEDDGLFTSLGLSQNIGDENFLQVSFNYDTQNFGSENDFDVNLYTASLEYYKKLATIFSNDSYLHIGGGLLGGYEDVNNGEKYLNNGYEVPAESNWIYGAKAGIEANINLFRPRFHTAHANYFRLSINAGYHYYANSDIGEFQPYIKTGLKYQFN